ncbi:helix-turn-helix transcriptional regulator [Chryseobacterium sp. SN22]|uniref:helix-turn-helix domain-containing protein n=1 Tax=Chryseobacterium sp. SN22 TaxID=2606431 RepID=UPI0011ED4A3C|nr:helix-turn-helix transcriptional regulator [Chryseobacterium sp. SN22]KAA0125971.1 helix-turn-helix transcriptional regulator [Chryseobacterium sp. SN22]
MAATAQKHIGRNIARIREMRGMKQETLAELLGVSQQKISLFENAEALEDTKLEPIAKALEISVEALKNFSEDAFFNIIANTYHNTSNDHSTLIASSLNYYPTFNPLDKLMESYEENRKLYERLLETEKEKSRLIEELVRKVMRD